MNALGFADGMFLPAMNGPVHAQDIILTRAGWEQYEKERTGLVVGNYGFFALKFGDEMLAPFINNHINPAIRSLACEAVDLRDVSQAGFNDNKLRVQIVSIP